MLNKATILFTPPYPAGYRDGRNKSPPNEIEAVALPSGITGVELWLIESNAYITDSGSPEAPADADNKFSITAIAFSTSA